MIWKTRDKIDCSDIEGTHKKKTRLRQTHYSNINYEDVTHNKFKTRRHVDPNDPIYEVKYKNGEQYVYGQIEKSKPQTLYPFKYADPFNLKISDIEGSQFGSKNRINKYNSKYSGLVIEDVPGAQSSSLKKGITTHRQTNPLNPMYILPGNKDIIKPENNPYGKTSFDFKPKTSSLMKRTLPLLKTEEGERMSFAGGESKNVDAAASNSETMNQFNHEVPNQQPNENLIDRGYCNTEGNHDREFYDSSYGKPDPFYGFIHDRYVMPKDKNGVRDAKSMTKTGRAFGKSIKEAQSSQASKLTLSKTNSNFKSTFAQKLDNFIASSS